MAHRLIIEALGALIEIDATARSADTFAAIEHAWAASIAHRAPADATVVVPAETPDDAMLSQLSTDVTLAALAHRKGELWMLHAAGLADARGHTVALVAPSGTGKTTAAKVLSRELAYVSDETVGIDTQGGVVPYRKPLSVIESASAPKAQVSTVSLEGERPGPSSLRLSKIAVLDRDPDGPEHPEVTVLSHTDALEALGPQTSYLCDLRAGLRVSAALLEATGGAVRIRYREAETLLPVVRDLLENVPPSQPLEPTTRPRHPQAEGSSAGGEERYFHAAMVDELVLADGSIALLRRGGEGGELRVLDGIGPAVWDAANGATFDELHARVVAVHGEAEDIDTHAALRAAVDELRTDGVLTNERSWCIADDVAWVDEGERTTVLALDGGQPLILEGSAQVIWSLLSADLALAESALVRAVAEQHGEEPETVHDDVVDFVTLAAGQGLVHTA